MIKEIYSNNHPAVSPREESVAMARLLYEVATKGAVVPSIDDIMSCDRGRLHSDETSARRYSLSYFYTSDPQGGSATLKANEQEIEIHWTSPAGKPLTYLAVRVRNPTFETFNGVPPEKLARMRLYTGRKYIFDYWRG